MVLPQGFCPSCFLHLNGCFPRNEPDSPLSSFKPLPKNHLLNEAPRPPSLKLQPLFPSPSHTLTPPIFAPSHLSPILFITYSSILLIVFHLPFPASDCKFFGGRSFWSILFNVSTFPLSPALRKYLVQVGCGGLRL